MFDARSILDILVGGPPRRQGQPHDPTVFKDMLDQLGDQNTQAAGRPQQVPGGQGTEQRYPHAPQDTPQDAPARPGGPGGISWEDLLRGILAQFQQGQPPAGRQAAPGGQGAPGEAPGTGPEIGKELQDLLRGIIEGKLGGSGQPPPEGPVSRMIREGRTSETPGAGGWADVLKQVLGQATTGAREGAARIDEATGLSSKARDALAQATGQNPEQLVAKLRQLIADNQSSAGAALGGLGALVLGTRAGRSLAGTAIKLGGLALIGGLAYKAYENYQQGRPPLGTDAAADGKPQTLVPAPDGSGFEARAMTHDSAKRYIRAMIAAAAADGRIDANEQQRILGGLKQAGLDDAAHQFLASEISNPATVAELAAGVSSPEEAVQVYTAARVAVNDDNAQEHAFLSALAEALGIDDDLAAQVDAAARATA